MKTINSNQTEVHVPRTFIAVVEDYTPGKHREFELPVDEGYQKLYGEDAPDLIKLPDGTLLSKRGLYADGTRTRYRYFIHPTIELVPLRQQLIDQYDGQKRWKGKEE